MRGSSMDLMKENAKDEQDKKTEEDDAIERALRQMESIYKSRCVQPQGGSNVTIREIKKDE